MRIEDFNRLVLNHVEGLKPFAVSLTRDPEEARDLCQETLCKALIYREKYLPETNMRAWLFTIMRNIFINNYRRNRRKRVIMENLAHHSAHTGRASETSVLLRETQHAIHSLPHTFRASFLLYLQGYKYHEIALALDEPVGTIKSRIHFARKAVRKKLDQ